MSDGVSAPVRVAMWSGPRNVSTALMRSFGARPDTLVVDEPLYAHYLATTGLDHPGRDEVLASQPTDWPAVAAALTGPLPSGVGVHYQKHMAHHLLPDVGRDWLARLSHAFLIRDTGAGGRLVREGARRADARGPGLPAAGGDLPPRTAGRWSTPPTCSATRPGCSAGSAPRSASATTRRCSPGRPARATPTASGPRTGTPPSSPPPVSLRTTRRPGRRPTPAGPAGRRGRAVLRRAGRPPPRRLTGPAGSQSGAIGVPWVRA